MTNLNLLPCNSSIHWYIVLSDGYNEELVVNESHVQTHDEPDVNPGQIFLGFG